MGKLIDKDEIIEIVINDDELSKLRDKLKELSESKAHFHFDIDKNNHLLIHHEEDPLL